MLHGGCASATSSRKSFFGFPGSNARSIAPVFFIVKENFLPALSSIFRTEDASLLVRPVSMTQRGDEKLCLSFCGSTRIRPICRESSSPMRVHVLPPSVDLYIPFP